MKRTCLFEVMQLPGKQDQSKGKVYEFTPGKGKKLKSIKYVSPEKKQLLKERKQAVKDKRNFIIGAGILLLVVVIITLFRLL